MQFPERRHHLVAKAQSGRSPWVPGRPRVHAELQIGDRRTARLKQGQHFRLGIERIEHRGFAALPAALSSFPGQYQPDRRLLAIGQIPPADFEQRDAARPAHRVALCRRHQPGDQRRAHMLHLFADRVRQHMRRAAEQCRLGLTDEAPVDGLVQPARRRRAPQLALDHLPARRGRLGHSVCARQRGRGDFVIPHHPHDFLDQVGAPVDVTPPARHDGLAAVDFEAEPLEDRDLLCFGHIDPAQRFRPLGQERDPPLGHRRLARARHRARRAAAMVDDQPRRDRQPFVEERRIDPALEPCPRIAGQQQFLPGPRDMLGVEKSAFDQDVGGLRRHPAVLAAHDPADVVHLRVVGDHRHRLVERVGLAIERDHAFARPGPACDQCAAQLGAVIDMQWATQIDRDEIGDIDQHRNRLLPDRLQFGLEPVGRFAVDQPAHALRIKCRATIDIVGTDIRRRSFARDRRCGRLAIHIGQRSQCPQSRRCKVSRNPPHAHAILPVGGDRDIEQAVVEPGEVGEARAHRRIGCELDDSLMLVAQLKLARRTHHAVRFDPADRRQLEREVASRDIGPRPAEHADHPGARIGRSAYHLQWSAVAGIDRQHLQLVRLRMACRGQHLGDDERLQCLGRIVDAFDFQPDAGQRFRNHVRSSIRHKMLFQPAQGELHAPTPPLSVGTSRKRKP